MADTDVELNDLSDEDTYVDVLKIDDNFKALKSGHDALVEDVTTLSSAALVDATSSVKGRIQLAGDLTGTAASPAIESSLRTLITQSIQPDVLASALSPYSLTSALTTATTNLQNQINTNTTNIAAKYTKPGSGIPKSDLVSSVGASLDKADSAVQPALNFGPRPLYIRSANGYIGPEGAITNTAALTSNNNFMYLHPVHVPRNGLSLSTLSIYVQTVGDGTSTARLGIYSSTLAGDDVFQRLVDAGTIATNVTGVREITGLTVSLVDKPIVWFAIALQGIVTLGPVLKAINGRAIGNHSNDVSGVFNGFYTSAVSGALPSTFTPNTSLLSPTTPACIGKVAG